MIFENRKNYFPPSHFLLRPTFYKNDVEGNLEITGVKKMGMGLI